MAFVTRPVERRAAMDRIGDVRARPMRHQPAYGVLVALPDRDVQRRGMAVKTHRIQAIEVLAGGHQAFEHRDAAVRGRQGQGLMARFGGRLGP